ncbi:MAG TPA: type II toxin-antitoxin system HicA family toxin [Spirochaetota bacterium]|nr:type II toxin-antitoxin system HicA family toxin [Spirochaetota bacterium]
MSQKLPALKSKDVIKIPNKIGFEFHRQKGSHKIFIKDELMVIVPDHNRDLKKGTLLNIIKGTGLSAEEFIEFY